MLTKPVNAASRQFPSGACPCATQFLAKPGRDILLDQKCGASQGKPVRTLTRVGNFFCGPGRLHVASDQLIPDATGCFCPWPDFHTIQAQAGYDFVLPIGWVAYPLT